MKYYKNVSNGYIIGIGTGSGEIEITESEYGSIWNAIRNKPSKTETTDYRLKMDLTWEEFEFEQIGPEEEPLDPQDALDLIFGGEGE